MQNLTSRIWNFSTWISKYRMLWQFIDSLSLQFTIQLLHFHHFMSAWTSPPCLLLNASFSVFLPPYQLIPYSYNWPTYFWGLLPNPLLRITLYLGFELKQRSVSLITLKPDLKSSPTIWSSNSSGSFRIWNESECSNACERLWRPAHSWPELNSFNYGNIWICPKVYNPNVSCGFITYSVGWLAFISPCF